MFIISRSLTVIDVKKVLRKKDEISWLSVAFLDYKPFLFYHNLILPKKGKDTLKKKGHNGVSKNS